MKYLSLILLLLLSPSLFAQNKSTNLQIMTASFPPFSYVDEQGKPAGFMTEIINELLLELKKEGKVELSQTPIQIFPWKRAYKISTETPNVLMYPLGTVPAERAKYFNWIGPKMTRSIWIYALKEKARKICKNWEPLWIISNAKSAKKILLLQK